MTRAEVKKRLEDAGYTERKSILTRTDKDGKETILILFDDFFVNMEKGDNKRYVTLYECLEIDDNGYVVKTRQETDEELDRMIRRLML